MYRRLKNERQNFIIIGFKGQIDPNEDYKHLIDEKQFNLVTDYTSDKPVITDDLFQLEN